MMMQSQMPLYGVSSTLDSEKNRIRKKKKDMWQSYVLSAIYLITMKIGIIGNLWVICSVLRNTRPQTRHWSRLPSDRLRSYIFVLALVDFTVVCSLVLRIVYLWDEQLALEIWSCRGLYFVEQISKMASMFCIACISIGRYITIRKPFNSRIRKHFYQCIPVVTLLLFFFILVPVLLTVETIDVTADRQDCLVSDKNVWNRLSAMFVGACFIVLLMFVSVNYGEIVRHVRRKFSKRKARESASCNNRHCRVSEPRYMREMTSSIVRVAVFHMICWLPFCFLLVIPTEAYSIVLVSIRAINHMQDKQAWLPWFLVLVNWLTFLNSALNWVFYAVLNRDLRALIRSNTERRKRSTMTYNSSFSDPGKSFRERLGRSLSIIHSYTNPKSVIVKISSGTDNECPLEPKILSDGQQGSINGSINGDCCYAYQNSTASSQNTCLLRVEDISG